MAIEIVDFPINSMVIFHSYVKLPEGISYTQRGLKKSPGFFLPLTIRGMILQEGKGVPTMMCPHGYHLIGQTWTLHLTDNPKFTRYICDVSYVYIYIYLYMS